LELKIFILLTLTLLVFSTPILVTMNVSAPDFFGAPFNIIKNASSPVQPCGDPVEDDPDLPH
jgi:hypothetical protein